MSALQDRQLHTTDDVRFMTALRASNLSLPALLCLSIVNENASARYPMVYPGEVEAIYYSLVTSKSPVPGKDKVYPEDVSAWTYSAISRHLRILAKKNLLSRQRDGKYVGYGMTAQGVAVLSTVFGKDMELRSVYKKAKKEVA